MGILKIGRATAGIPNELAGIERAFLIPKNNSPAHARRTKEIDPLFSPQLVENVPTFKGLLK
jgi:hypothetical protein